MVRQFPAKACHWRRVRSFTLGPVLAVSGGAMRRYTRGMTRIFDSIVTQNGPTLHVAIAVDGAPLRFGDALAYLQSDRSLRDCLTDLLARVPFAAFRWETPPLSLTSVGRPFEFVVIDAPYLEGAAAPAAFASYFADRDGPDVVAIDNLSRTATLIVPRGLGEAAPYAHFARFVRGAPSAQIHALWRCLGDAALQRLSTQPQWLSTAGAGIAWLHVRIDERPKYYLHQPYTVTQ